MIETRDNAHRDAHQEERSRFSFDNNRFAFVYSNCSSISHYSIEEHLGNRTTTNRVIDAVKTGINRLRVILNALRSFHLNEIFVINNQLWILGSMRSIICKINLGRISIHQITYEDT